MTTVIIHNVTDQDIDIKDMGITIGANASRTISNTFTITDICTSNNLKTYVNNEEILISDGIGWLTTESALTHITLETEYEDDINTDNDPYDYYPPQSQPDSTSEIESEYYSKIIIDSAKVTGSSNLENFPVLINITKSFLRHVYNGGNVQNINGYDIIFKDPLGTQLDHEIQSYDPWTGEIIMWVRLPILYHNQDTIFYTYYGTDTTDSQENISGVWDTNFKGVWHLGENGDGTEDEFKDSSGIGNHGQGGSGVGGGTPSKTSSGKIGFAQNFDGISDCITMGDVLSYGKTDPMTYSAWVKTGATQCSVITKTDDVTWQGVSLYIGSSGLLSYYIQDTDGNYRSKYSDGLYNDDNWHYVVVTNDGSDNASGYTLYADGVVDSETSTNEAFTGVITNNKPLNIGSIDNGGTYNFDGIIDEARLSNIDRSASWVATEYNNQNSPEAFLTMIEFTPDSTGEVGGEIIQVIDTYGGVNINNVTPTAIQFSGETYKDNTLFNHSNFNNPTRITVYESGIYRIGYSAGWFENNTFNAHIQARVRKNGETYIPGSDSYKAGDLDNREEANCNSEFLVELEIYDYVEVMCNRVGDDTTIVYTEVNASWFYIEKI